MSSFHERQKNLFNTLKNAEDECNFSTANRATNAPDYGVIDKRTYRKLKHEMKQFRGRESIYKKSDANIRECLRAKTIPDHIKNPQKYVYYSLSDVTPEQMSDSTNTATALALIQEMEQRAANKIMEEDMDDSGVFKKPTFHISKAVKKEAKEEQKPVFRGNKIIMPEYVVGMSKKKETKNKLKLVKPPKSGSLKDKADLKLNHLYDDDEEE